MRWHRKIQDWWFHKDTNLKAIQDDEFLLMDGSYGNGWEEMGAMRAEGAATLLLGIPAGLLLGEPKGSAVANRAPIPLGG